MARMLAMSAPKWADSSYCCGKHCPGMKKRSRGRARRAEARRWRREASI